MTGTEKSKEIKEKEIDELDLNILRILGADGREKISNIAETLHRSPNTIKSHVEKMENDEIIKNYGISIDYEKLGYDIMAVIEITIAKGKMIEVEKKIAHLPNIFAVYDITGTYDALILAKFKKRSELSEMVKEINSIEEVIRSNTHLILNVIKEGSDFGELLNYEK